MLLPSQSLKSNRLTGRNYTNVFNIKFGHIEKVVLFVTESGEAELLVWEGSEDKRGFFRWGGHRSLQHLCRDLHSEEKQPFWDPGKRFSKGSSASAKVPRQKWPGAKTKTEAVWLVPERW